tara:strand:- start:80 stop:562 length:483 start_codon:yes stop_codon:yes gene_type:complete
MTTLATKISRSVSFQESPALATARRLQHASDLFNRELFNGELVAAALKQYEIGAGCTPSKASENRLKGGAELRAGLVEEGERRDALLGQKHHQPLEEFSAKPRLRQFSSTLSDSSWADPSACRSAIANATITTTHSHKQWTDKGRHSSASNLKRLCWHLP